MSSAILMAEEIPTLNEAVGSALLSGCLQVAKVQVSSGTSALSRDTSGVKPQELIVLFQSFKQCGISCTSEGGGA